LLVLIKARDGEAKGKSLVFQMMPESKTAVNTRHNWYSRDSTCSNRDRLSATFPDQVRRILFTIVICLEAGCDLISSKAPQTLRRLFYYMGDGSKPLDMV